MHKPSTKEQQVLNRALMRSTERIDEMKYFDIDGNQTTLEKLVTEQPAWACSRIRADRERIEKLEADKKMLLDAAHANVMELDQRIEKLKGALTDCVIRMDRARSIVNATNKDPQVRYLLYTTRPRKALEDG